MEQIIFRKIINDIRKSGLQIRVAADINEELLELSEATGLSKVLIVDTLLRAALKNVAIEEEQNEKV